MKKYYIDKWSWKTDIKEVEVIKESEHSVWLNKKHHELKETREHKYCETWDEAYGLLLKLVTDNRNSLVAELEEAQSNFKKVSAMKKP